MGVLTLLFCLLVSVWIMTKRFALLRRPSIVGTVFLTFFVMHGLSAIPYTMDLLDRSMVIDGPVNDDFPYVLGASFLFFALGAALAAGMLRFDLAASQKIFFGQPISRALPRLAPFAITAIAAIALALLFAYGSGRTGWQLLLTDARNEAALRDFRISYIEDNPYYYIGTYGKILLLPMSLLISMNAGSEPGRRGWTILAWLLFGLLLLTSIANLHKLPVIIALIFVLLNRHLRLSRGDTVSLKPLLVPGVAIIILGPLLYFVTYDLSGSDAFAATLNRTMVVPQACLEGFLTVYPRIVPFNYGLGIGLIAKLAGVPSYASPPFVVGEYITGESQVSANAFWSTEMWAAFGYFGVIIGSMLAAGLLVGLDRWVLRRPRSAVTSATYAYLIVASINVPSGSIFTAMLSGGLGLAPLICRWLEPARRAQLNPPIAK